MNSTEIVSTTYFDLPLEVNNLIKEFLGWTENVRNSRNIEARANLDRALSVTWINLFIKYKVCDDRNRVRPNNQIGDEIYGKTLRTDGDFPICGKVVEKNKYSIDVNVYGWIRDDFNSKHKKFIQYRWKKNVFILVQYSSLYSNAEFKLNDNTGFKKRRLN